ncbi:hypothetical protein [Kitasatospora sp. NPDC057015]|uniref:hypothetical protein n=1 Tax=Kitasatospora sp. NPDC057015 TaxID=3346001 RepID=UPI0036327147
MGRHLVDNVKVGWSFLGTDLLDGAPDDLRAEVAGHSTDPSRELSGAGSYLITDRDTGDVEWAYVLHPHGIEVIGLSEHDRGPVVPWETDPRSRFSDRTHLWLPDGRLPVEVPARPGSAAARAGSGAILSAPPKAPAAPAPSPAVPVTAKASSRAR